MEQVHDLDLGRCAHRGVTSGRLRPRYDVFKRGARAGDDVISAAEGVRVWFHAPAGGRRSPAETAGRRNAARGHDDGHSRRRRLVQRMRAATRGGSGRPSLLRCAGTFFGCRRGSWHGMRVLVVRIRAQDDDVLRSSDPRPQGFPRMYK